LEQHYRHLTGRCGVVGWSLLGIAPAIIAEQPLHEAFKRDARMPKGGQRPCV
jgi:hypothetical protein